MSASRLQYYEAIMSHPELGWMAVAVPGFSLESAERHADTMIREDFPEWIVTVTGDPYADEP